MNPYLPDFESVGPKIGGPDYELLRPSYWNPTSTKASKPKNFARSNAWTNVVVVNLGPASWFMSVPNDVITSWERAL